MCMIQQINTYLLDSMIIFAKYITCHEIGKFFKLVVYRIVKYVYFVIKSAVYYNFECVIRDDSCYFIYSHFEL